MFVGGKCFSDEFPVSNGIKQGGVLSSILYTVYNDDLLVALTNLGVCCFSEESFVGAVCYADDLALLAPLALALQVMLRGSVRILQFYIAWIFICPRHSQFIFASVCPDPLMFCGSVLPFLDSVVHLGHV